MKNHFRTLLIVAVLASLFTSCTKEKQALKKLHGTWLYTDETLSEEGVICDSVSPTPNHTTIIWEFTNYNLVETRTDSSIGSTSTNTFDYTVNEDANELTIINENSVEKYTFTIDELSSKFMDLSIVNNSLEIVTACTNGFPSERETRAVILTRTFTKVEE